MNGAATESGAGTTAAAGTFSNGKLLAAVQGLEQLSSIGTADLSVLNRLAKMITVTRTGLDSFYLKRDTLVNNDAKRGDDEKIVTRQVKDGVTPVMENEIEHELRMNELLREPADVIGEMPPPFTWRELTKQFRKVPDANLLSKLGPFADLNEK